MTRHLPFMERCRERYGGTFTLRFPTLDPLVVISDPDAIKALFAADRDNTLPSGRALTLEPILGPRSVLLLEGEEHMRRRKLMLPPFHGDRMRAYEGAIARAAAAEIERWPRGGEPFALRSRMQAITLDVILDVILGVTEGPRHDALRETLAAVLGRMRRPLASAATAASRPLGSHAPLRRLLDRSDALLAAEIAARRADPELSEREDVLALLLAARFEDGTAIDDAELRDQLMTLLVAGHETTATALAWAFDLLLHDPERLDRARAGEDAYLDAVGTEALRLRPVITSVGRRITRPLALGGLDLPAGASVLASIYLTHTRPDLYPDPYAFRPERFEGTRPDTFAWLPFGGGVRRCIGASFAQLEMRVVLREVLRHTDLRAVAPRRELPRLAGVTLVPSEGTRVRLA